MGSFGVDVSSNNPHPINWTALYAYLKRLGGGAQPFAIVKISQGTGYVNNDAPGDIASATAAGFAVAGYMMDQGNDNPAAEVALYNLHAQGLKRLDDIELPEGLGVAEYVQHTAQLVTLDPSVPDYLNQSEEDEGFSAGGGYWEANYNGQPGVTHRSGVLIHQYTSSGVVPGCAGKFDLNYWLGTPEQFAQMFAHVNGVSATVDPQAVIPPEIEIQEKTMTSVLLPNGKVAVYAIGAGSRAGQLLEFTRTPNGSDNSVIDITDQIGGPDPYTVES